MRTFPYVTYETSVRRFQCKSGEREYFQPTIRNESLHQNSNDNGVRIVNFATSENLAVHSKIFPHRNIHKYTWTSSEGKTHNKKDHILIGDDVRLYSVYDLSRELTVILITIW